MSELEAVFQTGSIVKEGEKTLGKGLRESVLIDYGYTKLELRKMAKKGILELIQCRVEGKRTIINVYVLNGKIENPSQDSR